MAAAGQRQRPPLRQLDSLWVFTAREAVSRGTATKATRASKTTAPDAGALREDERRRRLVMAFMDRLCQRIGEPVTTSSSPSTTTLDAETAAGSHRAERSGVGERLRASLRLPITTLIAARLLFHRFFLLERFDATFDELDIATACVSIACKATENVVRMRDLVRQSYALRTGGCLLLDEQLHQDLYVRCRERIAQAERDVLQTLNWDLDVGESVHRTMFHQWALLEKLIRARNGDTVPWSETSVRTMLQVACSFLNEAHRTVCACLYPKEELAAAALCVAMCLCRLRAGEDIAQWLRECHIDAPTLASALDRFRADYFARLCRAQRRAADAAAWQRLPASARALGAPSGATLAECAVEIVADTAQETTSRQLAGASRAPPPHAVGKHQQAEAMRKEQSPSSGSLIRKPRHTSSAGRHAAEALQQQQQQQQQGSHRHYKHHQWPATGKRRRPKAETGPRSTPLEPPFQ